MNGCCLIIIVGIIIISDFSFANWLKEMEIPSINDLNDNAKSLLIQQLGIDQYLLDTPCDAGGELYLPSLHGWKNRLYI